MQDLLKGKTAIITGGSSGIGRATAVLFAAEGADVVIGGRKEDSLRRVKKEILTMGGGRCEYVVGDVDSPDNPENLLRTALDCFGGLDILVCCAGTALRDKSLDMSIED